MSLARIAHEVVLAGRVIHTAGFLAWLALGGVTLAFFRRMIAAREIPAAERLLYAAVCLALYLVASVGSAASLEGLLTAWLNPALYATRRLGVGR